MRRRRKGPDALLTAKLDTAWSLLIRAKGFCERCGRSDRKLDAAHIVGRQNFRLRWDERNGMCLCSLPCHAWWHDYPLESAEWIRGHRPEDVAYLEMVKNDISHWTPALKKALLAELQSSLAMGQAA